MNPRRVFVVWFGLVALYTVVSNADQTAGLIGWASTALDRLASPAKALIPDRSNPPPPPQTMKRPAPYRPGYTPPPDPFPSWLTPSTGQQQQTPGTGRQ